MIAATAATVADLVTFLVMLALLGPSSETNPLIRTAIAAGFLGLVIAAKLAIVVVLATWSRAVRSYRRPVALAGTTVGLIGAGTNIAALIGGVGR